MVKLGLIPLDERPCNAEYPRLVGKIAGAEVITPPRHMLSSKREVGHCHELESWLTSIAGEVQGLVVSIETLVYGGLIPSRISSDTLPDCIGRLNLLRRIKGTFPQLPIYAFNIVMRISNSNNNEEEPLYWSEYGKALWLYSRLSYRVDFLGMTEEAEERDAVRSRYLVLCWKTIWREIGTIRSTWQQSIWLPKESLTISCLPRTILASLASPIKSSTP